MAEIFDKTLRALATSARMRQVKQNVVSANIANAETPGYKAKKIDFEEALAHAIRTDGNHVVEATNPDHFPVSPRALDSMQAEIYDNPEVEVSNDGNTVDLQREMSDMVENNIAYRAATQLINKKLAALKYAANDGGR
ncbi:MAG: flagellar basal body rod protein FlgB [Bdellovibrionales bacterium]|nr:flagellar basal body rod protein FlgB [Bdellovibrionales bacterium]